MIETKVKAATTAAAVTGFVVWLLATYVFKGTVPAPVSAVVAVLIPAVVTFVTGYLAKHDARLSDAR